MTVVVPTALGLVVCTDEGAIIPGTVAILTDTDGSHLLTAVTNKDGYAVWPSVPLPYAGTLTLTGAAQGYVQPVTLGAVVNPTIRVGKSAANPQDVQLPGALPFKRPFVAAPRDYEGNMCGTHVAGLNPIPGGASDPTLVVSWLAFYHPPADRQRIYADHLAKGLRDFLVSWPDFQDAGGTPDGFKAHCLEVLAAGLRPCAMLSAKPTSSANIRDINGTLANILLVLPSLLGVVPRVCFFWEGSLWLSPEDVQFLIDNLSPLVVAAVGTQGYVHFAVWTFSWQINGQQSGAFWLANVGKLHGVMHQSEISVGPSLYVAKLKDCLDRFAGDDNCPADSGIPGWGPFNFISLESTSMNAFNDGMDEATQNQWASLAASTPPTAGPFGPVPVSGSGNGVAA